MSRCVQGRRPDPPATRSGRRMKKQVLDTRRVRTKGIGPRPTARLPQPRACGFPGCIPTTSASPRRLRPPLRDNASPAAEARDRALLPDADASTQGPGGDECDAYCLVAGQGEDHSGGAEGCGQPDGGPVEGVLRARLFCGVPVRRVRSARRCSVRLRVIRMCICSGHGKPSLLKRAGQHAVNGCTEPGPAAS